MLWTIEGRSPREELGTLVYIDMHTPLTHCLHLAAIDKLLVVLPSTAITWSLLQPASLLFPAVWPLRSLSWCCGGRRVRVAALSIGQPSQQPPLGLFLYGWRGTKVFDLEAFRATSGSGASTSQIPPYYKEETSVQFFLTHHTNDLCSFIELRSVCSLMPERSKRWRHNVLYNSFRDI